MSVPSPFYKGKVRNLYDVSGDSMIIVASDRVSAFDVVFNEPIPEKGKILTHISSLWFQAIRKSGLQEKLGFMDQMLEDDISRFPEPYTDYEEFRGRSVLVRKCNRIDFEFVVRGYLAGSAWKEYASTGKVAGQTMPAGLSMASKLPTPIFTPATKAPEGEHDENISVERMKEILGTNLTKKLETISIEIFQYAASIMYRAGIILCDTKFEFGMLGDKICLIDEVLTPDSSRYWDVAKYKPGSNPPGFDKQYIRDHLENSGWNKEPPAPPLSSEVIESTTTLYQEIEKRIEQALSSLPTAGKSA